MRNTFIRDLVNYARKYDNIVLIVGDLGFSVVEPFAEQYPDRFINVGLAEQNMVSIAAGMASEGYHVFIYSIANFSTFRCAEQIRNDIDYHNLAVTVVSVGGGLAYGNLGYSHHGVQDFALLRSMPNMLIAAPGDPLEVSACIDYIIVNPQPSYLRINKTGERKIHASKPLLSPGKPLIIKTNNDSEKLILATGAVLELALEIWGTNKEIMDNWSIGSLPLWGEAFRKTAHGYLKSYSKILTLEEHLLSGGFGSWILENDLLCKPCYLDVGLCGEVGSQDYLKNKFGLNKKNIVKIIEESMQ